MYNETANRHTHTHTHEHEKHRNIQSQTITKRKQCKLNNAQHVGNRGAVWEHCDWHGSHLYARFKILCDTEVRHIRQRVFRRSQMRGVHRLRLLGARVAQRCGDGVGGPTGSCHVSSAPQTRTLWWHVCDAGKRANLSRARKQPPRSTHTNTI